MQRNSHLKLHLTSTTPITHHLIKPTRKKPPKQSTKPHHQTTITTSRQFITSTHRFKSKLTSKPPLQHPAQIKPRPIIHKTKKVFSSTQHNYNDINSITRSDIGQHDNKSPQATHNTLNNDDFPADVTNIPLTAEELFYELPPLSHDMFELEPREHRGTIIWLPDCFETHSTHGKSFQIMMAKQLRVVVPNPPLRECTVLGGEEQRAWYDVMSVPFKPSQCDLDYIGMKTSMYQLHQLIRDEAIRIGQKVAPFNAPAEEIERLGTERIFLGGFGQGAALALFSGLRYPMKLAGVVSHSGYIPFIDQTKEAAKLLTQNQRKEWELNILEEQKLNHAERMAKQTTQEHFHHYISKDPHGEKTFDISISAPNLRTPLYILHNHTDTVFPWLELAQPSFIKAAMAPLRCNVLLHMGKSTGHSIASLDLLEMHFWANSILGEKERSMPPSDLYEREKLREFGEFGDSTIVVDKYSPHADRVTMPWTSPRILESANVAQQDVKRVEELLKLIPKHPQRLDEIVNEIELLNNEADEELWKAYLIEAHQFVKHHEKYMVQRREQDQARWEQDRDKPTTN
jgi:phospholipase/carboxylesterase